MSTKYDTSECKSSADILKSNARLFNICFLRLFFEKIKLRTYIHAEEGPAETLNIID